MAEESFGARPIIYRNGEPLAEQLEPSIARVQVESDLHAPDSCRIHILDPARTALADSGFEFLDEIVVRAAPPGEKAEEPLFEGKVYSLGFDFDEAGAVLTIGAFDTSYALFNGLHTTTWQDQTDADVAQAIAKEVGLEAEVESTSVIHPYIAQINETHWEFLARRARELDYEVTADGKKLVFRRPKEAGDGPEPGEFDATDRLQLAPGGNLQRFSARVTAAQQVAEVEVRGWDPVNKQAVVATQKAATRNASLPDQPADVASKNGSARRVTTHIPLATQAEVDAAAAAEAERAASTFTHAEGVARGDPRLLAGTAVSVGQTGGRFDGKYTVTHARHDFGHAGYRTGFSVTGRHDRSILGLTASTDSVGRLPSRIAGVVIGVVTNVKDPEQKARVKLKLPWLSDDFESDWARVAMLGAADQRGFMLLPEVNDEVLVAFEQGDVRRPFVLGGLFNGVDAPPWDDAVDTGDGTVQKRGFKTRRGHRVLFDDSDGNAKIELATSDDTVRITFDEKAKELVIETDKNVVVKANGDANVTANQNISIEATRNARIKAGASLTLEGGSDVTIKGAVVRIN